MKELLDPVDELGGMYLVTADHGNADDMVQRNKKGGVIMAEDGTTPLPLTSHTLAPVPVAIGAPRSRPTLSSATTSPRPASRTSRPRISTSWVTKLPPRWNHPLSARSKRQKRVSRFVAALK